jgi:hypothetical protein
LGGHMGIPKIDIGSGKSDKDKSDKKKDKEDDK